MEKIVIIGAGQAGLQTAISLRSLGYTGRLFLVGDEPYPPYQRPPLSKTYLKGEVSEERLFLKPPLFYEKHDITLKTGCSVDSLDRDNQRVFLSDGTSEPYDRLVLAMGARPRKLPVPGADLQGVYALRGLGEAHQLHTVLNTTKGPVALIGGGYIGLEIAAAVRSMGREIHVFEAAPRLLARSAGPDMAQFFYQLHTRHGVVCHLETGVEAFLGEGSLESLACLSRGGEEKLHCDTNLALVCVGAEPCDSLARKAGLACDQGILTDSSGRTEDPSIFALGDVAVLTDYPFASGPVRLESVPHAIEQGKRVAAILMNQPVPPFQIPWFWSDQYDVKLQIAGLPAQGEDSMVYAQDSSSMACFHFKNGHLIACETANMPRIFMGVRQALNAGALISRDDLRKDQDPVNILMHAAQKQ